MRETNGRPLWQKVWAIFVASDQAAPPGCRINDECVLVHGRLEGVPELDDDVRHVRQADVDFVSDDRAARVEGEPDKVGGCNESKSCVDVRPILAMCHEVED